MKIEKGIPVPPKGTNSLYRSLFLPMVPGDSRLFDTESQAAGFRTYLSKQQGMRGVKRKVDGGWRVWMFERKPAFGLRVVG